MKLQTSATQVALRTANLLRAPQKGVPTPIVEPTWYRVVLSHPPTHQLLPRMRNLDKFLEQDRFRYDETQSRNSKGFYVTRNKQKYKAAASHLYRTPKLRYTEDRIRHLFYTNHPWEMARPRNVIENGTPPVSSLDWSSIIQPRMRLSGESVVQRTMWLAKQPSYLSEHKSDWFSAYEQARLEFYRVRMREHAESQVAQEEALMHGAVLGPSSWDTSLAREQRYIEKYIVEASEASKELQAKRTKVMDDDSA